MSNYILSLDQGTTGSTALLLNSKTFVVVDKATREFTQHYPSPGQVEHNLEEIWISLKIAIDDVLKSSNINPKQICSIGITNQRETICAFHKDGKQIRNAIVWQDRRTIQICEKLKAKDQGKRIQSLTGLPVDPYFSASKISWMLQNDTNVQKAARDENLFFGTIDTYILYRLTGGRSYKTEPSNASRTLLFGLNDQDWNPELLSIFEINRSNLPKIVDSMEVFGTTQNFDSLPDGIPITGILGDQQSALFGQACVRPGEIKCTYGTGAFALMNTGPTPIYSKSGLLTTIAYQYKQKRFFALEGSSFIAGAAVQWLRDELGIISIASQVEGEAKKLKNLNQIEHLLFLPFFSGIGTPHWKPEAKAAILGITRDTGKAELAWACLTGIALSIYDLIESFKTDYKSEIKDLKVDGGASNNNLLMEIQATFLKSNILRPLTVETTALGAAFASAVGANIIDIDKINNFWKPDKSFSPQSKYESYCNNKVTQWQQAIKRLYY